MTCIKHPTFAAGCRACLRAWLDRKPHGISCIGDWREWFSGGEYLGERSARTGPDETGSPKKCTCEQCAKPPAVVEAETEHGFHGMPRC